MSEKPLRGSGLAMILYDVCEEIWLDRLRDISGARPVGAALKHAAPEYVRFQRPPVVEPLESVVLEGGQRLEAQIKYYDYGVISILFLQTAPMNDITRVFQAFLAPAIFVSATALLILSVNVRLMGIVARLRQYVHARHDAAKAGRTQEADAYSAQLKAIEARAELIRRCFLLSLLSLVGTIASCLLLGLGIRWIGAAWAAVVVFVLALICLLAGTLYYIREVMMSLSSVRNEERDLRFMDLGSPPGRGDGENAPRSSIMG